MSDNDIVERLRIRQPLLGKLCDEAADRIEALEAALRVVATAPTRFDDGSLGKIDVPYGRGIIKGLESSAEIARAALASSDGTTSAGSPAE